MKKLLLLIISSFTLSAYCQKDNEIIPLDLTYTFNDKINEPPSHRMNEGFYRSVNYKLKDKNFKQVSYFYDSNGVFEIILTAKNINNIIKYLDSNYEKIYDVDNSTTRYKMKYIVYTNERYQFFVDYYDKEIMINDFSKRAFKIIHDDFYNYDEKISLRFDNHQEDGFGVSTRISLKINKDGDYIGTLDMKMSEWLYSNKILFSINNGEDIVSFYLKKISDDVSTYNGVNVHEKSSFKINKEEALKIYNSKSIIARVIGEKKYEFMPTLSQIYAFGDLLKHSE